MVTSKDGSPSSESKGAAGTMGKNRLEAFSDGVIAIIITIMVLEMKVPHGDNLASLAPLIPVFISYVLSFTYVAIYWNNHHHLLHAVRHVTGATLWANMHLLILALGGAVRHRLDGRKPFSPGAGGALWLRIVDGSHRLHHPDPGAAQIARRRLGAGQSDRQ